MTSTMYNEIPVNMYQLCQLQSNHPRLPNRLLVLRPGSSCFVSKILASRINLSHSQGDQVTWIRTLYHSMALSLNNGYSPTQLVHHVCIYICMYIPMIWNGHELLVLPHFRNKWYPSVAQVWAQRFRLIRWLGVKKLQTMVFSMTQGGILPRFSWIVWCFEELWRDKSCMTKSSKTKPSEVPTFIQVVFFYCGGDDSLHRPIWWHLFTLPKTSFALHIQVRAFTGVHVQYIIFFFKMKQYITS